jgi:hypothetical protein
MRRCTDLLALDPLSPITDIASTTDPLALEPLSPLPAGARPIDAGFIAAVSGPLARGDRRAAPRPSGTSARRRARAAAAR